MASAAHTVNFGDEAVHKSELLVSRNAARERDRSALRLLVGRGRQFSVAEASQGSGVPERAIEAAMCGVDDENYRPLSRENLASLTTFLGAAFASAYLELSGLGAFELAEAQPPLPRVLSSAPASEDIAEERKRLIRRLAELEGVQ